MCAIRQRASFLTRWFFSATRLSKPDAVGAVLLVVASSRYKEFLCQKRDNTRSDKIKRFPLLVRSMQKNGIFKYDGIRKSVVSAKFSRQLFSVHVDSEKLRFSVYVERTADDARPSARLPL